jgi:ureidoglycolate lyase
MTGDILIEPLTAPAFAPFGEVLDTEGAPDKIINAGLCGRWHDRATLDMSDGRVGLSLFRSETRALPYRLEMVERHPLGSQAFVPMSHDPVPRDRRPRSWRHPGPPPRLSHRAGPRRSTSRATHGTGCSRRCTPRGSSPSSTASARARTSRNTGSTRPIPCATPERRHAPVIFALKILPPEASARKACARMQKGARPRPRAERASPCRAPRPRTRWHRPPPDPATLRRCRRRA